MASKGKTRKLRNKEAIKRIRYFANLIKRGQYNIIKIAEEREVFEDGVYLGLSDAVTLEPKLTGRLIFTITLGPNILNL